MTSRWPVVVTLAGVAAWVIVAVVTWAGASPLGHDEARFMISAREAMAGAEPRWFYLSSGMHAIVRPGIWLGGSELAVRFVPLVLGCGFLLAAWAVARRTVSALSAGITLLVLVGAYSVARLSTDLLSDLPAAAALLTALAVILGEIDRADGARWRIVIVAPLFASAIYVRYGSVVPIAVMVLATLAVGARTGARRPWPVVATAGLFVVLLVPHLVAAQHATGSPLGILLASREVPHRAYFGEGLVTYLTSSPYKFYGALLPIALVAGLVSVRLRDHRRLLAWLVAVGSLIAMGLTTHAQPRYILVTIVILAALGTEQIAAWIGKLPPGLRRVAGGIAVLSLVLTWLYTVRLQYRASDARTTRMRATLTASALIRRDSGGGPCTVIGYHYTQLEWYSGCRSPLVSSAGEVSEAHGRGERVYVVRDYLPSWASAPQPVIAELPGRAVPLFMLAGELEVARLLPP